MRFNFLFLLPIILLTLGRCKNADRVTGRKYTELPIVNITLPQSSIGQYQPTPEIEMDILHMCLDLRFNWSEREVIGQAELKIKPFFSPVDTLRLNARGFTIYDILLEIGDKSYDPKYLYDGEMLSVIAPRQLERSDTFILKLSYSSFPEKIPITKGAAITSNQGLYFINPDRETPDKPQQLWSQGEPECNSSWFPTIDHPTEKFTHEIRLTVDPKFQTISNGRLVFSFLNKDGTRTDHWAQDLPHSAYLVMIAVGKFYKISDHWREMDVNYYLDSTYASVGQRLFGNTPDMIDFYSNALNYPFPWAKYDQVVVKDFVSGAMENTTAVVHGDFIQLSARELIDENHEDVIAHELFHHWFGDLVTCESWSQLTLNEGFATYGEYLWIAHKYGEEEAQIHMHLDREAYFSEASHLAKPLERFYYSNPDEVFDAHTYQKGALVLHMLRNELGEETFFAGLHSYLSEFAYKTAEIEDLRQALESVSGRDLRWFFEQWFERPGHPIVECSYGWNETNKELELDIVQLDSSSEIFSFHLPLDIGLEDGGTLTKSLWINKKFNHFTIQLIEEPIWYCLDAKEEILAEIHEIKKTEAWIAQASQNMNAPAQRAGLLNLAITSPKQSESVLIYSLESKNWFNREFGTMVASYLKPKDQIIISKCQHLSLSDPKAEVRALALNTIDSIGDKEALLACLKYALADSSYRVIKTALYIISRYQDCALIRSVKPLEKEPGGGILHLISNIYAACPRIENHQFFDSCLNVLRGADLELMIREYGDFAKALNKEEGFDRFLNSVTGVAMENQVWWIRLLAIEGMVDAQNFYTTILENEPQNAVLKSKLKNLSALLNELKETESSRRIKEHD